MDKTAPSISLARQLVATINKLIEFAANFYFRPGQPIRGLNKEERGQLFDLEGKVVGLVAVIKDGRIPFEGRPANCADPSRFTSTGLPCTICHLGLTLTKNSAWEIKMLSLRAAAQAVIDAEEMSGQTDNRPDTRKDRKKRPLKNLIAVLGLKKAIARGEKRGQTMQESALEFTDGDDKRAQALLRSLRRNRSRSELM